MCNLIEADPDDAEAYVSLGQALALDSQPKEARAKLEECIERHPEHVPAYVALSEVLHRPETDAPEAADALMDTMVENNRDDPDAYVERSRYYMRLGDTKADAESLEAVDADVRRAVELDPEGKETLIYAARYEARRHALLKDKDAVASAEHLELARGYATRAAEAHPDSTEATSFLAQLDSYSGNRDEARDRLDAGLKDKPLDPSLLLQRADIYLAENDVVNLRRSIADMRRAGVRSDQVDLYEARALMLEGEWLKARDLLARIRPRLIRTQSNPEQIDLLIGSCYLNLGQRDRALASFKSARDLVGDGDAKRLMTVETTLAASLIQAGKMDEGISLYRRLSRASVTARRALVSALIQQQGAKPKERREWSEIERLLASLEEEGDNSLGVQMSRVEMLSQQGRTDEAFAVLDAVRAAHPEETQVWVALSRFQARYASPQKGLEVLDQARAQLPASSHAALLDMEIRIMMALPTEEVLQRLPELEKKVSAQDTAFQPSLFELLGQAYGSKGDNEGMVRLFRRQAELQGNNVKVRTNLLTIARATDDTELAAEMVGQLKEILGSNSPTVRRIEAEDIVTAIAKEELSTTELDRARRLVDGIEAERPDWVVVPRLRGEIERLDGNVDRAIANYQRALELGENNPKVGRVLLGLLTQQQRLDEIDEVLEWLRARGADEGLGKISAMNTLHQDATNVEEALPQFEAAVKDSTDFRDYLALGGLRQRAGKPVEAEAAFRQAVELDGSAPGAVEGLVRFLASVNRTADAEAVIREANGKLPSDVLASTTARCYELIGDQGNAESHYLKAIDDASDKTIAREDLAKFYRRIGQNDKLATAIDQIIQAGADENNERAMASLRWARLVKAGIIAAGNNFRTTSEALALIEQNKVDGELDAQNKAVKARILAARSDQQSRKEAVALYEEVFEGRNPSSVERITLARLYELTGQWSRCRDVMFAAMSDDPNNQKVISLYIEMSMRHREFADVKLFIDRLEGLAPDSKYVKAARGRLLVNQGDVIKGVALIKSLVPKTVTDANALEVRSVADLLSNLQQHEAAEQLYRDYVAQRPDDVRYLARFLASYPDADLREALKFAEQDLDVSIPRRAEAIASGLTALRNHRVDVEPADYDRVKSWIDKALADDPNSISHTLQLAELNDIKGDYDQAEALYHKVIATESVTDTQIAIAENNLAYLLALSGRAGEDALPMIEDAITRLGPISQLLDTRGMVYLKLNQVENALSDFEGAVVEEASGMGFYHLALAQQASGDIRAATRSFDSAKSNGFRDTNLSRLERPQFDQLMQVLGDG